MTKKERVEIRALQGQWVLVVLGSFLAVFLGVAVNALYEILRTNAHWPAWVIFISFGALGLWWADMFFYIFENLSEFRKAPNDSMWPVLAKYFKVRFNNFRSTHS